MSKATKLLASGFLAGTLLTGGTTANAVEVTTGLDIRSAYVFRGVTFNDGFVAQPYIDIEGLPIEFGVWGNFDIEDYDGAVESGQFSEIDIYASYSVPVDVVDLSIGYTEYTFPQGGGDADREIGVALGLDAMVSPYIAAYYGLDGGIDKDIYLELGVGYETEIADDLFLGLGALVGYLSPDEGDSGFHQYELSASLTYDFITAGVTYYGQIDDDVLTDNAYDVEVVGTLGVAYTF